MAKDNYVERKQYKGLKVVDGQVVPDVGDVEEQELLRGQPEVEEARRNGGGTDDAPKRTRQPKAADKE